MVRYTKAQTTTKTAKIDQLTLLKVKTFVLDAIKKVERQLTEWKKIFVSYISGNGLNSLNIKRIHNFIIKGNHPTKTGTNDLIDVDHFYFFFREVSTGKNIQHLWSLRKCK